MTIDIGPYLTALLIVASFFGFMGFIVWVVLRDDRD